MTPSMLPAPSDLASVLPIAASEVVIACTAAPLDGTYLDYNPANTGVSFCGTVDLALVDQAPQFVYKRLARTKNGYATAGVVFYKQGVDVLYQAFFWVGDTPTAADMSSGALPVPKSGWKGATPPTKYVTNRSPQVMAAVPAANWCGVSVEPLDYDFTMAVLSTDVTVDPPSWGAEPSVLLCNQYTNDLPTTQPINAAQNWNYLVSAVAAVTNTISVKAGLTVGYSLKVGGGVFFSGEETFSVSFNVETSYSQTTTSTTTEQTTLGNTVTVPLNLAPGQTVYVVTLAQVDNNATGHVTAQVQLSGTVNGGPIGVKYLTALAEALSSTITVSSSPTDPANSICYTITGVVNANVLGKVVTQTQQSPPAGITPTLVKGLYALNAGGVS
jgi:hypothetical protein